jgi:hypothetical protein
MDENRFVIYALVDENIFLLVGLITLRVVHKYLGILRQLL